MMKNPGIFLLSFLLLLLASEFFVSSCASRGAPGGGPQDTIAPVLDTSFPPNFTTNFTSSEVELIFNEYISLKSPQQQITFSPPLSEKPEILSRGKSIIISWSDTLLDSTTYTISFGNSIADFTEGNVNDNFKYVFSTGDFIDSLELQGTVLGSQTGGGVAEIMVALYDYSRLEDNDSIPFESLPTYYAYTDEAGRFSLSNLKYGNFHVVAFQDSRGNFKMSTGTEQMAFMKDTLRLSDTTKPIKLIAFDPAPAPRSYAPRHVSKGRIQFPFNYSVDSLEIIRLDSTDANLMEPLVRFNENHDTASYWFEEGERDSIRFLVKVPNLKTDTPVVFLRNYVMPDFSIKPVEQEVKFNEPVALRANLPVDTVIFDSILTLTPKDSLGTAVTEVENDNPFRVMVQPASRAKEFRIYIRKGAVKTIFGPKNDSLMFSFTSLTREDLGNLDFMVETDSSMPLVLVIYDPDKQEILRESFRGDVSIKLQHRKPGMYGMELILDENADGEWSTGNYFEWRQPERVLNYKDQAEIRANWDMELIWQPEEFNQAAPPSDTLSVPSDSTNSSRSDKN